MAVLKTIKDCMLYTGFDIYPLTLDTDEYIEFTSVVAIPGGTYTINEHMLSDGEGTNGHLHTTLSVNLAGLNVLPGVYDWDLKLVYANGAKMALMPKRYNRLIIEESEDE